MLNIVLAGIGFMILISTPLSLVAQNNAISWMAMDRSMVSLAIDLASDTATAPSAERQQLVDAIYGELEAVDSEYHFALEQATTTPDPDFTALVAAEGNRPLDYNIAIRRSNARSIAAERAGVRDWMSKHHTAARKYAALAAEALRRQASENDQRATSLQNQPFAVRRPLEEAEKVLQQLMRDGLSEAHRILLKESVLTPDEIATYERKLQATPAGELGMSMVELYRKVAEARRELAAALEQFAKDRETVSGQLGQSFIVGNPHDRDEWVHLFLRRAAMPPEWTLSLAEVEPTDGKSAQRLQVVEAGRHYQVRLPGKGHIRMASIVTPVGTVAENTTARWAVEGRIDEELLGGIVQEVNVPAFLRDLELPPIAGPASVTQTAAASDSAPVQSLRPAYLWVGALVLLLSVILIFFGRRRRTR